MSDHGQGDAYSQAGVGTTAEVEGESIFFGLGHRF